MVIYQTIVYYKITLDDVQLPHKCLKDEKQALRAFRRRQKKRPKSNYNLWKVVETREVTSDQRVTTITETRLA